MTDAAGNYTIHYFYTIDTNDGDPEKLTGKEYQTKWYSSSGTLLKQTSYEWQWRNTVQAYNTTRKQIGRYIDDGKFNNPEGIAVYGNYVYVVDTGNNCIQKFTTSGTFVTKWGSYGSDDGQFNHPIGIVAYGSYVYVVDSGNNRIQKFNDTGYFITKWGSAGSGNSQFNNPCGIAICIWIVYMLLTVVTTAFRSSSPLIRT